MATMFRELALALIVAIVLLVIGLALEVVPVGIEPIETPWRATVVMLIGLLIVDWCFRRVWLAVTFAYRY